MHSANYEIHFQELKSGQRYLQVPEGSEFLHLFNHCGSIQAVTKRPVRTCQCAVRMEIPLEPPRQLNKVHPIPPSWKRERFEVRSGRNTICAPANWVVTELTDGAIHLCGPIRSRLVPRLVPRCFYVFGCNQSAPADVMDRLSYVGAAASYSSSKRSWEGRVEFFELIDAAQLSCACNCFARCLCASTGITSKSLDLGASAPHCATCTCRESRTDCHPCS